MQVLSSLAMNTLLSSRMGTVEAQIQQIEQQMASGQKASTFAGLGSQAPIDIALHNEAKTIETYQTGNQLITARIKAMDQAMTAVRDAAESVKNEAYALTNADTQRTALIAAARTAFDTVVNSLQISVAGRALFSGTETETSPLRSTMFSDIVGNLTLPSDPTTVASDIDNFFATPTNYYQGGIAIQPAAIDKNLTVNYGITGDNLAFRDILQGLATIALSDGVNTTDSTYATTIQNAAAMLSSGVGQLNQLISTNGSNQALVEGTNAEHEATLTMVQRHINDIEETDMTSAATQLSLLRTQLQATYTITGQIGQLSLVNYLK